MLNIQKSLFDSKFYQELQDSTDNFLLLNNLLNLDDNRKDSENYLEGKDWLDLVDFKEETGFYVDPNHPVKDSERKRKHNKIERARRLFIDAKIRELGLLLPQQDEAYYELAKDIKHNKGGILRASVIYVRILKSDLLKKQRLEEICNSQHDRLSQMINKIREYEREMRSYEIPVREFNIEDPPDYGDVFKPTEVPVLPKKVKSSEKEALKSFEQLDDLDDDVEMVTKEDPMLSAFASSNKTKVKRTLSTESLDSELGSPGQYQKSKKGPKTEKKNIRKIKRRVSSAAPVLELHNSPRIPVVSRPVYSQARLAASPPVVPGAGQTISTATNMIFPLPKEVYQLPNVQMNSPPSFRYSSSSSEDEPFSPSGRQDNRFHSAIPLSVIKKLGDSQTEAAKRKIILQER